MSAPAGEMSFRRALTSSPSARSFPTGYAYASAGIYTGNYSLASTVTLCAAAGSYCPGIRNAVSLVNLTTLQASSYNASPGVYNSSAVALTCPTGTTNAASGSSVAACSTLSAGYALVLTLGNSTTAVADLTLCSSGAPVNSYCPGAAGVLHLSSDVAMSSLVAQRGIYSSSVAPMPCPPGTGNAASGASVSTCVDILQGWSLPLGASTSVSSLANCTAASVFCPGITGVLSLISDVLMTSYTAAPGSYSASAVALSCPAGITHGSGGLWTSVQNCTDLVAGWSFPTAGSFSYAANVTQCNSAGSYCPGLVGAFNSVRLNSSTTFAAPYAASAGVYNSSAVVLTCPTGTTNAASGSSVSACASLAAGFALTLTLGSSTTAVANLTLCSSGAPANTYCPGAAGVLSLTSDVKMGSLVAQRGTYSSSVAPMLCPSGTGDAVSGSSVSACVDLLPGYSLPTGTTTVVGAISNCTAASVFCPGITGVLSLISDVLMTSYTAAPGSYSASAVALSCPAGITHGSGGLWTSVQNCTDLVAGWSFPTAGSFSYAANVTQCNSAGSYCPGLVGAFNSVRLNSSTTFAAPYAASAGVYNSSAVVLTCPTGTTNAASGASVAACSSIAPSFSLPNGTFTLVSSISACVTAGSYCPGITGVLSLISDVRMASYTAAPGTYSASAVALSCPAGLTSLPNSNWTAFTSCTDIAAGAACVRSRRRDVFPPRTDVVPVCSFFPNRLRVCQRRHLHRQLQPGEHRYAVRRSRLVLPGHSQRGLACESHHAAGEQLQRIAGRVQLQRSCADVSDWDHQRCFWLQRRSVLHTVGRLRACADTGKFHHRGRRLDAVQQRRAGK